MADQNPADYPIGTNAFPAFERNVENLDTAIVDRGSENFPDRKGVQRYTYHGMETRVDRLISSGEQRLTNAIIRLGFLVVGDYGPGIEITEYNQVVRKDGEFYGLSPSIDLPYTTTGDWLTEGGDFLLVGDPRLRQQLADDSEASSGASLVGYRQTGTGARGRTALDRMRDTASILDYKIAENIDDTLALQALIDSHQYATFVGPEHTFVIRDAIRLRNGSRLDLRGAKIVQMSPQTPLFDVSDRDGIVIWGGELVGAKDFINSPSARGIGVFADGATDIRINDVTFRDFGYSGVACLNRGEEISVTNCTAIGFADELGSEDRNNMGFCVGGTSISITGCRVRNTSQGIYIVQKSQSVIVADNIIKDIPVEHGMYLDHSLRNAVISNNTIRNVGHMGMKVQWYDTEDSSSPENITITGNSIYGCGDTGLAVYNSMPLSSPTFGRGISIIGNTISEVAADGIIIRYVEQAQVSGNSVYSCGNGGISADTIITANITSNVVNKVYRNGIHVYGLHVDVNLTNNNLIEVGNVGPAEPGNSTGIVVSTGSRFVVADNNIRSLEYRMAYGISIGTETTAGSVVRDNYIRGHRTAGIRLPTETSVPLDYFGGNVSFGMNNINSVVNLPAIAVQGDEQARVYSSNAVPTTGTWAQGDRVRIRYPNAGGPSEYVCVNSGTPGTWRVSATVAS